MSQATDAALLSDSQLDAAYAAYYDAGDLTSANIYAQVILTRLQSFGSFLEGALGVTRFPLFDARQAATPGGFQQAQAAQSSISTSAGNLASAAGNAIKSGLSAFGTGTVLGLAIVAIVAYLYLEHGKK